MPWCPDCKTEYEAGRTDCARCGAPLVGELPVELPPQVVEGAVRAGGLGPVVVLRARTGAEAQVAVSTLSAEGIEAFVQAQSTAIQPGVDAYGDAPEVQVLVGAADAERAAAILNEPPLSDAELDAAEQSAGGPVDGV